MTAFDTAWALMKADEWHLWPKEEDEEHEIGPLKDRPAGYNKVDMYDLDSSTSHVNLPFLDQYGSEEDIAEELISTDIHEDSHKAMELIGEFHDSPKLDEYFPHIAEALYRTRNTQFPMSPTELARIIMGFHTQVKRGTYD